jgi:hypothetical protein
VRRRRASHGPFFAPEPGAGLGSARGTADGTRSRCGRGRPVMGGDAICLTANCAPLETPGPARHAASAGWGGNKALFPNLCTTPHPLRWAQRLTPAETGRRRPKDTFGKSPTAAATNVGENGRQLAGEVIGKLRRKPAGESSRARVPKAKERRPGGPLKRAGEGPGNHRAMGGGTRWANPAGHCPGQPALSSASTTSTIFCCRRRGSLAAA